MAQVLSIRAINRWKKNKNKTTTTKKQQQKSLQHSPQKMGLVSKMFIIRPPVYGEQKQARDK